MGPIALRKSVDSFSAGTRVYQPVGAVPFEDMPKHFQAAVITDTGEELYVDKSMLVRLRERETMVPKKTRQQRRREKAFQKEMLTKLTQESQATGGS